MKPYIFIFLIITSQGALAQQPVKEYSPKEILPLDLSPEGALKRQQDEDRYVVIQKKMIAGNFGLQTFSAEDQRIYREVDAMYDSGPDQGYWDAVDGGCNWYCAGGPKEVRASSELKSQGENTYTAENAHDLSYKNAWAEGAPGPGIGEYLIYTFVPSAPRITEIIVANGYLKSERAYRDNARVKKLKVYLNEKPFAILNLEDRRSTQHFPFPPIGNGDRLSGDFKNLPPWTLKFEILEVYKGAKYDDTVITEIYFDGIDDH
jgi:hypothetical protein